MGCRGKGFGDCMGLIVGCLGKETKVENGRDLDDMGRNKCGKWKDNRIKGSVCMVAGACHVACRAQSVLSPH